MYKGQPIGIMQRILDDGIGITPPLNFVLCFASSRHECMSNKHSCWYRMVDSDVASKSNGRRRYILFCCCEWYAFDSILVGVCVLSWDIHITCEFCDYQQKYRNIQVILLINMYVEINRYVLFHAYIVKFLTNHLTNSINHMMYIAK